VLKVETDIITSIKASLTGRAMLQVIMYVEIFKTGVNIFIHDVKISELVLAHASYELPIYFLWIKVSSLIHTLSAAHLKGKMSNLPIMSFI
jgi:hypothetical protein